MTNIIIQGICGRMGRALQEKIAARTDCRVVAGVDQTAGAAGAIPVYASLQDLPEGVRGVIIDFTGAAGAVAAADYAAAHGLPCVICSTGLSAGEEARLEAASEQVPVFRSANMSLGVNVLIELCKQAVTLFGGEFDIEIVEKHHHNKLDAPSGTALMIAACSPTYPTPPSPTPSTPGRAAPTSMSMTGTRSASPGAGRNWASRRCGAAASWGTTTCCSAGRKRWSP